MLPDFKSLIRSLWSSFPNGDTLTCREASLIFLVPRPKEINNVYVKEDLLHKESDPQSLEPCQ